jgi:hypothetical protein
MGSRNQHTMTSPEQVAASKPLIGGHRDNNKESSSNVSGHVSASPNEQPAPYTPRNYLATASATPAGPNLQEISQAGPARLTSEWPHIRRSIEKCCLALIFLAIIAYICLVAWVKKAFEHV